MLYSKDNPKRCELCAWADETAFGAMLCYKKGPVSADAHCRGFRYDPFKKVPPPRVKLVLKDIPSLDGDPPCRGDDGK